MKMRSWEERYVQLQKFLHEIDQSSLEKYMERLRELPTAELSRYAAELEKRSIQLSLEEGAELRRVRTLDVLGKSNGFRSPLVHSKPPKS